MSDETTTDAWSEIDRWTDIEKVQTRDYLAREVAKLQAVRRWLMSEDAGLSAPGSCCGHLKVVHMHGGCTGLKGSDWRGWSDCRCEGWVPHASEVQP